MIIQPKKLNCRMWLLLKINHYKKVNNQIKSKIFHPVNNKIKSFPNKIKLKLRSKLSINKINKHNPNLKRVKNKNPNHHNRLK